MSRYVCALACGALLAAAIGGPAQAQQQQERPPIETRKVDGTDNVSRFSETDKLRMLRLIQLAQQMKTPLARATLELLAAECPLPEITQEAQRILAQ